MSQKSKEEIVEFPFMIPPDWLEKMKCPSKRKLVAFYWSAQSDEIAWNDGDREGISEEPVNLWYSFMRHSEIERFMCSEHSHFGYNDATATHWLLIDTKNRQAYIATVGLVGKILVRQHLRGVTISSRARKPDNVEPLGNQEYFG